MHPHHPISVLGQLNEQRGSVRASLQVIHLQSLEALHSRPSESQLQFSELLHSNWSLSLHSLLPSYSVWAKSARLRGSSSKATEGAATQHTCTNSPGVTVLPGKPRHCPTGPSVSGERQWTETNLQSTPCHEVLSSAFISTRTTQLRLRLFFNWRPSGLPPKARETLWIGSLSHQPSEACSFRDLYPTPFSDGAGVPGPCGRGDCVKKEHAAHDRKAQVPLGHPMSCFPVTESTWEEAGKARWRGVMV